MDIRRQMNEGIKAEKQMTKYHDYLITSVNLLNPCDSNKNERGKKN